MKLTNLTKWQILKGRLKEALGFIFALLVLPCRLFTQRTPFRNIFKFLETKDIIRSGWSRDTYHYILDTVDISTLPIEFQSYIKRNFLKVYCETPIEKDQIFKYNRYIVSYETLPTFEKISLVSQRINNSDICKKLRLKGNKLRQFLASKGLNKSDEYFGKNMLIFGAIGCNTDEVRQYNKYKYERKVYNYIKKKVNSAIKTDSYNILRSGNNGSSLNIFGLILEKKYYKLFAKAINCPEVREEIHSRMQNRESFTSYEYDTSSYAIDNDKKITNTFLSTIDNDLELTELEREDIKYFLLNSLD